MRRIVLVGATGAFGARLAGLLAGWPDVDLVLAARRAERLRGLAAELGGLETVVFDRNAPEQLAALRPWAVVDAAGPFQGSDFRLAQAAIDCRAHYVDLADARDFVATFPAALDVAAREAGVLAVTGASSTPALSHAALDALTRGWREIDRVTVAISPGARAPRGVSVVRAILSYVGRPVRVFEGGRWRTRPGWSGPRRVTIAGLGRRWVSLCETPDLDLLPQRFAPRRDALFLAGLELPVMHLALWLLSWPVRLRLVRSLQPLARILRAAAGLLESLGSDRGGMVVVAEGKSADGAPNVARWSLVAEANAGPTVPVAAAAAVLRGLKDRRLKGSGAVVCVGLVSLEEIVAELAGLPIRTGAERLGDDARGLFARVLGQRFAALPAEVTQVHGGAAATLHGRGRARGSCAWPLRLGRRLLGLPQPGRYPQITVRIATDARGETWTRTFGGVRFSSRLSRGDEPGQFEERFGPAAFTFEAGPIAAGFRWRFVGWRLGTDSDATKPRAADPRPRLRPGRDLPLQRGRRPPLSGPALRLRRPAGRICPLWAFKCRLGHTGKGENAQF
jgi:saccharopine dehydrogenase-like NADP-dependent oxidoreductase